MTQPPLDLDTLVTLEPMVPRRFHFYDYWAGEVTRVDPLTKRESPVMTLRMYVDEVDGIPQHKIFSTLSRKLMAQFAPLLPGGEYRSYDFIIVKTGDGFTSEYAVTKIPRTL